jgi:hypothetical protein
LGNGVCELDKAYTPDLKKINIYLYDLTTIRAVLQQATLKARRQSFPFAGG